MNVILKLNRSVIRRLLATLFKKEIKQYQQALEEYVKENCSSQTQSYSVIEFPQLEIGRAVLKVLNLPLSPKMEFPNGKPKT